MKPAIIAAMGALALAGPANAGIAISSNAVTVIAVGGGNFEFSQGGWSNGGFVTGSFSGNDDDGYLVLDSFEDEITAFSMSFSGNSRVPVFSLGFDDLVGLVFRLDNGMTLGDDGPGGFDEGILAVGYSHVYAAGPGPLEGPPCGIGEPCAFVANVPEPANWAMMIAGFGLVGAIMRRRNHRAPPRGA